jgi:hypothetical protein
VNQSNVRSAAQELNLLNKALKTKSALETNSPDESLNLRSYHGGSLLHGKRR